MVFADLNNDERLLQPTFAGKGRLGRGKESKTLYITAGKSLYRIGLNGEGYQLPEKK